MPPRLSKWSFPASRHKPSTLQHSSRSTGLPLTAPGASLLPPGLSKWSFPASWCLPGASQAVQLVLSCFPGASQAVQLVLSCLPGALQAVHCPIGPFLLPWCLPGWPFGPFLPPCCLAGCPISPFLPPWCLPGVSRLSKWSWWSWHLPGSPNGLLMALGCLLAKQNQICWPWQITGVSWSCLGRLLESSGRGNLGRSPKP